MPSVEHVMGIECFYMASLHDGDSVQIFIYAVCEASITNIVV